MHATHNGINHDGIDAGPTMSQLARRRGLHQPVSSGIIILPRAYYAPRDRNRAPAARIETQLRSNLSSIVQPIEQSFLDRSETV